EALERGSGVRPGDVGGLGDQHLPTRRRDAMARRDQQDERKGQRADAERVSGGRVHGRSPSWLGGSPPGEPAAGEPFPGEPFPGESRRSPQFAQWWLYGEVIGASQRGQAVRSASPSLGQKRSPAPEGVARPHFGQR